MKKTEKYNNDKTFKLASVKVKVVSDGERVALIDCLAEMTPDEFEKWKRKKAKTSNSKHKRK